MTPERWRAITEIFHAALERGAGMREPFLDEACHGDSSLKAEIEAMLAAHEVAGSFGDAGVVPPGIRHLAPGTEIGGYRIQELIGSGGMGEVYRARDSQLARDIALKVLPTHLTSDPERRARLAREARMLATLSHAHIGAIYGLVQTDNVTALVLELVEGPTLADRLARAPLPLMQALAIARQIADALDAAHEKGIVHRDLKPANIILQGLVGVADGDVRARVLDFGLAKMIAIAPPGDVTSDPSVLLAATGDGRILGTPAYMSPEQARGLPVDKRTDIWAFGCVVYEMLTGRRAFSGETVSDTIAAILGRDPDWTALPAATPPNIRRVLSRCLLKDSKRRLRDIGDARADIEEASATHPGQPAPRAVPAPLWRRLAAPAAAILVVAATAATTLLLSTKVRGPREPEFRRLTFREGNVYRGLLAPGSNAVLYTAAWKEQQTRTFTMLPEAPGLERALESDAQLPMAFSDDATEVLVLLGTSRPSINAKGTLAVWPAVGGRPRPLVENAGWADWAAAGRIITFVRDLGAERLLVTREAGAERILFRTGGAVSYVRISPDRNEVAFIHHASRGDDAGEVRITRIDGSESPRLLTPVFERCLGLDWNQKTGEIWFTAGHAPHGSSLLAVDRRGNRRTLQALPEFAVLDSVSVDGSRWLLTVRDESTTLAVRSRREPSRDLTWLGLSLVADVSPDGTTVLFWDGGGSEKSSGVWLRPVAGGEAVRLGAGEPKRFSPDARSIVAVTRPSAGATRFLLIPVGAGTSRSITPPDPASTSPSFAGTDALLFVRRVGERSQVWTIKTDGTGARSLGGDGCDYPMSNPAGDAYVAICGQGGGTLQIHSLSKPDDKRTLFALPDDDTFLYARWDAKGGRVFGVTRSRRLVALDSSKGTLVSEERLPFLLGKGEEGDLMAGALSSDAGVQAYSARRTSSRLYLGNQIR